MKLARQEREEHHAIFKALMNTGQVPIKHEEIDYSIQAIVQEKIDDLTKPRFFVNKPGERYDPSRHVYTEVVTEEFATLDPRRLLKKPKHVVINSQVVGTESAVDKEEQDRGRIRVVLEDYGVDLSPRVGYSNLPIDVVRRALRRFDRAGCDKKNISLQELIGG